MLFRQWLAAPVIVTLGAMIGCASSSPNPVEQIKELPNDVSPELQQKFEVKDTSTLPPEPMPSARPIETMATLEAPLVQISPPLPPKKRHRSRHKRKSKEALAAEAAQEAPPFEYPNRRPPKDPIWPAEEEVYDITYFGMSAGDFTLDVLPFKAIDNRKVYHVRGTAVSSKVFSLFYRLDDMVETFIDYDGLFSHRFHIMLDETKQTRDSLELNDSEKKQTFYWNRWNRPSTGFIETKEFQPIEAFSQDSLSALYYLRTLPLQVGDVYSFPVISEGKSWVAEATVVRKEEMETVLGRVETVVVKPETKYQGVLQKRGDSYIWFTNDPRHIVVRLEAKVKIGSVVAILKKIEPGSAPAP